MQEISLNVLDVAQNSVSAGASLIEIDVAEDRPADRLTVTIRDNGCGMTEEQVKKVIDPFYTTRTTRKVGLGVPLFKMAAEMTGGSFSIVSQPGKGTTVTAVFVPSHLDCMPMGDITATVCSLIQCNPDRDFCYTYSCNGKGFSADTRQFREVLEGIPLNSPEVIQFISEFITENTCGVQPRSQELSSGGKQSR